MPVLLLGGLFWQGRPPCPLNVLGNLEQQVVSRHKIKSPFLTPTSRLPIRWKPKKTPPNAESLVIGGAEVVNGFLERKTNGIVFVKIFRSGPMSVSVRNVKGAISKERIADVLAEPSVSVERDAGLINEFQVGRMSHWLGDAPGV
jgi:hypothetical protein